MDPWSHAVKLVSGCCSFIPGWSSNQPLKLLGKRPGANVVRTSVHQLQPVLKANPANCRADDGVALVPQPVDGARAENDDEQP